MLSELAFPHIRCCLSDIPSDLMKSTAVDESLSTMNQQFCSRENQLLQMLQQNEKSTKKSCSVFTWFAMGCILGFTYGLMGHVSPFMGMWDNI